MLVFNSLLNNTFTVERKGRLNDGMGGFPVIYEEIGEIEGRICPTTSTERTVADSVEAEITHVFYTLAGSDLARGDRLNCGDFSVEVEAIREPSLSGEHWEVDCKRRVNETSTQESGS